MNRQELLSAWLAQEACAHIHGWDFSHIEGRYTEQEDLPWDYRELIHRYLTPKMRVLDYDTGGGEFLLSLNHPYPLTAATEGYPPNVELCRETLLPLGIDFRPCDDATNIPFADESFDMILNRHGDFDAGEIHRLLRPGGLFITQQVGAYNDRELVEKVLPGLPLPFPDNTLEKSRAAFEAAGFKILEAQETFRPIEFYDVGAFVWFARIIEWEFPGFSVDRCLDRLYALQEDLERDGKIAGTIHRFLLIVRK